MNLSAEMGISVIAFLQSFHSDHLDYIAKIISFGGTETFYVIALPIIWLCFDQKTALLLLVATTFSTAVNFSIKELLEMPRPFEIRPELGIGFEPDYAFPSGHAQNSLVFWGVLAWHLRVGWLWVIAGLMTFFIGLSRLYLGVHYPTDVLGGWIIGGVILTAYMFLLPTALTLVKSKYFPHVSFFLMALLLTIAAIFPLHDIVMGAGVFCGILLGFLVKERILAIIPRKSQIRIPLGLFLVMAICFGLKIIFPRAGESGYSQLLFVRFFLGALVLTFFGAKGQVSLVRDDRT